MSTVSRTGTQSVASAGAIASDSSEPTATESTNKPKAATKSEPAVNVNISPEGKAASLKGASAAAIDKEPKAVRASNEKDLDGLVDFYAERLRRAAKRLESDQSESNQSESKNAATNPKTAVPEVVPQSSPKPDLGTIATSQI